MSAIHFRESQRFPAAVFFVPSGAIVILAVVGVSVSDQFDWLTSGIAIAIAVGIASLWAIGRLDTEVRDDGVHVRLRPLARRHYPFEVIATAEARTYRPLVEYGGWGLRYGVRSGVAINARGNRGVQLVMQDGKRLLIGSQRAEELAAAIQQGMRAVGAR